MKTGAENRLDKKFDMNSVALMGSTRYQLSKCSRNVDQTQLVIHCVANGLWTQVTWISDTRKPIRSIVLDKTRQMK